MTRLRRWLPLGLALYAALLCVVCQIAYAGRPVPDFLVFWTAGHALLTGQNPYTAVDGLHSGYPLFYPLPAVLALLPVAWLPWRVAWVAWAAILGSLLGLAGARRPALLPLVLSAAFLNALAEGTYTPLVVSAAVLPWLAPMLAVKPSIGAACFAWRPSWWAVVGGLFLTGVGTVLVPTWPLDWWHAIQHTNHVPPVLRPGGVLLLLAWLRWRTPEGRLLGLLAVIPQTASLYETLPLFLLCRTRREGYVLAVLSFVAAGIMELLGTGASIEQHAASAWPGLFLGCYLPALALVLRPAVNWRESRAPTASGHPT